MTLTAAVFAVAAWLTKTRTLLLVAVVPALVVLVALHFTTRPGPTPA